MPLCLWGQRTMGMENLLPNLIYSVHKKYGDSNSCIDFNTNSSTMFHVIETGNYKYPFSSSYQISDTVVKYFKSMANNMTNGWILKCSLSLY